MAKTKTQYFCSECGYTSAQWLGKCPSCDSWNSFAEEPKSPSGQTAWLSPELGRTKGEATWVPLTTDNSSGAAPTQLLKRIDTGISELNRVLGGGLVQDSFTLLGGDPGIGKSTLLLQMAKGLLSTHPEKKLLYASGEESVDQIRGRAHRIGIRGQNQIFLASETVLEKVLSAAAQIKPDILIIDSLQTFSTDNVPSSPGSVSQVREITGRLMGLAKSSGIAVWLVGHITKDGSIAGPKTIEHMVDTVLYFEGESGLNYRLLRAVKNRFGSTRELGVFEMDGEGLSEVSNPSSLFLSERKGSVAGTAVAALLEGSRPLMVELQSLVTPSGLAVPRRTSVGMDSPRVSLLAAILEKHLSLPLAQKDLFFNVVGGLRLSEPACDLAAAASIWSSCKDIAIAEGYILIGEVGLTGEVRRVSQTDLRIEEAKRLGFTTVVLPASTPKLPKSTPDLKICTVSRIDDLPRLFQ